MANVFDYCNGCGRWRGLEPQWAETHSSYRMLCEACRDATCETCGHPNVPLVDHGMQLVMRGICVDCPECGKAEK